jgi:small subunit ribosomal protein S6
MYKTFLLRATGSGAVSPEGGEKLLVSYELLYIVDPRLSDEDLAALQERMNGMITAGGGEVQTTTTMGTRKLAYPIKKLEEGKYILVNFRSETSLIQTFTNQLKLLQSVVRFMIVNLEE